MKKMSIIVPVYYNEGSLSKLFERLVVVKQRLLEKSVGLQLIFVDDGSGDNSLNELLRLKETIKETISDVCVVKLTRNFGAVHACKAASKYVEGDCFSFLAADLQDPPELILEMVDQWLMGSKFVICRRNTRQDPWLTKQFSHLYYFLIRVLVDKNYPKGGFDMTLMDKSILPYLLNSGKNIYTPLYIYWLGFKPTILHYDRLKREHGKSRWTFSKKITALLDSLLGFSILPIRLVSVIGFSVSLMSLAYGTVIVVNTLLGKAVMPGFPTIVALITFLLGSILFSLGMIGEYLWRTFDEVNHRPSSVIDEVFL